MININNQSPPNQEEILRLSPEQQDVLDRLEMYQGTIFLTGKAGTGKSTLLKLFRKTSRKNIVCLAPTGVASVLIGGQTIHSFFRFPPGWISPKDYRPLAKKVADKIEMIIIDEISMVRADMLDHIDRLLRISKKSSLPFGGIPMLWIGDLYQLPPVVSSAEEKEYFSRQYQSPYFFSSKVMKELTNFELIELNEVFRQRDQKFVRLLNRIRLNETDESDLEEINERFSPIPINDENPIITLTSTNAAANDLNMKALMLLDTPQKSYSAQVSGSFAPSHSPADPVLTLKEGAQIMTLKNDPQKQYHNGSLGVITELGQESIQVRLEGNPVPIEIQPAVWDLVKYKLQDDSITAEVVGSFTQLPVKLAWAMTIHKSQGKTFDRVCIDLGKGAFEFGQAYVALSRCRSLEGIYLKQKLSWRDIQTDERVSDFLRAYG